MPLITYLAASPCTGLKKFLKKHADGETLALVDAKLGGIIKEKLGIPCIYRCVPGSGRGGRGLEQSILHHCRPTAPCVQLMVACAPCCG